MSFLTAIPWTAGGVVGVIKGKSRKGAGKAVGGVFSSFNFILVKEMPIFQFWKEGCLAYCLMGNQTHTVQIRLQLTNGNQSSSICFCSSASKLRSKVTELEWHLPLNKTLFYLFFKNIWLVIAMFKKKKRICKKGRINLTDRTEGSHTKT